MPLQLSLPSIEKTVEIINESALGFIAQRFKYDVKESVKLPL